MGPRDIENNTVEIARRDTLTKETISMENVIDEVSQQLKNIQKNLYERALTFRNANMKEINSYEEFKEEIEKGGFLLCHWDGTSETEEKIKEETKATIRCIPFDLDKTPGKCMVTGKPSAQRVVFARAY